MNIAVVNSCMPFVYGGAEFLADSLKDKLIEYGHKAIVIKIPYSWIPPEKLLDHILACKLLNMSFIDRIIALKFPAYYVEHGNKVVWLLHQFRQAYELWGTEYRILPTDAKGEYIRDKIMQMDTYELGAVKKLFTNSNVVSARLKRFNGLDSEVLYPPLMNTECYYCKSYGDYIFYPSRITRGKRQHLAVESMNFTKSNVKLIIAGQPETQEDIVLINSIIQKYNLHDKVKIIDRFISQQEKFDLFANALGCIYIPYDEDSYGYVTLEAYHSKKPVITCTDSGGTDIVVKNGETGYISEPAPEAIAETMDRLYNNRCKAQKLGENGYDKLIALNISWDYVIERLTT